MSDFRPAHAVFLDRIILSLLPYFTPIAPDLREARRVVVATLADYPGRTPSQLLESAQIIAYGFTALDSMGDAIAESRPPMRLRLRNQANGLNRSKQQCQAALARAAGTAPITIQPVETKPEGVAPVATYSQPHVETKPDMSQQKTGSSAPATNDRVATPPSPAVEASPSPKGAPGSNPSPAVRLPGVSSVAMFAGADSPLMSHGSGILAAPPALRLAPMTRNASIFARAMGHAVTDLSLNGHPAL